METVWTQGDCAILGELRSLQCSDLRSQLDRRLGDRIVVVLQDESRAQEVQCARDDQGSFLVVDEPQAAGSDLSAGQSRDDCGVCGRLWDG